MPAKKKTAKKPARRKPVPSLDRQVEALANTLMGDSRLSSFITGGGACDVAQRALLTLADERDQARKDLADARRGREAWFHKAVECYQRAEIAEEKLRKLQAEATEARPSIPVKPAFAATREVQPAPTYGLPGDAPTTRFYKEFRG